MNPLERLLDPAVRGDRVLLMGVFNATPDSFSDGGVYANDEATRRRVDALLAEGSDILDIGGESTRPSAKAIAPREQMARIEPALVYAIQERRAVVSVDTTSPEVAEFALSRGAAVVNDVSCLADDDLAAVTARFGARLVLMHARGSMTEMRGFSDAPGDAYQDVVVDVSREWQVARERAVRRGLEKSAIVFDPGLGFMKNAAHSLELIQRLGEFASLGALILAGPSRKSFIAKIETSWGTRSALQGPDVAAPPDQRLGGTIAACLALVDRGAAVLRVHDVAAVKQAIALHRAIGGPRA